MADRQIMYEHVRTLSEDGLKVITTKTCVGCGKTTTVEHDRCEDNDVSEFEKSCYYLRVCDCG